MARIEKDAMGPKKVPSDKYWGAQTQRSKDNFKIGDQKIPIEIVHALSIIKAAAAKVNYRLKKLKAKQKQLITRAAEEIYTGKLDDHFPLVVWQTGSGTQTNMNVNEVIANRAIEMAGGVLGSKNPVHPNDHVNMSQSTNDTFPTAIHLACLLLTKNRLLPQLEILKEGFSKKAKRFHKIIKSGRTHLMDAAPVTVGQEFSGYAEQIEKGIKGIKEALSDLSELAIGATAVGTGLNAHPEYREKMILELSRMTKHQFQSARNLFQAISSKDACVKLSSSLKTLATDLIKIGQDIRFSASGPRNGIEELILPANEPGSSIMPGKVNPTQIEALIQVSAEVIGNDVTLSLCNALGQMQLNAMMPLIAFKLIESIKLLTDVSKSFHQNCLKNLKVNQAVIQEHLKKNLILATALNQTLGYDLASKIVKYAQANNISLKQAAVQLNIISPREFDQIVDPKKMI